MTDSVFDKICNILLKYRIIRLGNIYTSHQNINQAVWHEIFSENLIFIVLSLDDNLFFELMIQHHHITEPLDDHIINSITHQYKLSDKMHQILIDDDLMYNLEDKLKDMHMYIRLKYL